MSILSRARLHVLLVGAWPQQITESSSRLALLCEGRLYATEAAPAQKSSILPSFIRNLLPGAKDEAGSSNVGKSVKELKEEEKLSADEKEELAKMKDADMDGYASQLQDARVQQAREPKVTLPPMPRSHPDYSHFIDMKRAYYLRRLQHEKIIEKMTPEQKSRVIAEEEAVLKDKKFIEEVASMTAGYIDLEVQDCIKSFLKYRKEGAALFRYNEEHGRLPPRDQKDEIVKEITKKMEEEKHIEALKKRDEAQCPVVPILSWAGPQATCSKTGLKYYQCCGANIPGMAAPGQYPNQLQPPRKDTGKRNRIGRHQNHIHRSIELMNKQKFS